MAAPDNSSLQFNSGAPAGEGRSWLPRVLGIAVVLAVVALAYLAGHFFSTQADANQHDPYLANLQVSNLHMSTAENFAGGQVTYIEGRIANQGSRKVTAVRVQVVFKNDIGEVSQNETLTVMVQLPNSAYADFGPMDQAPLAAGQSRDFRLTLEHVTLDWNGQLPQVKPISASIS